MAGAGFSLRHTTSPTPAQRAAAEKARAEAAQQEEVEAAAIKARQAILDQALADEEDRAAQAAENVRRAARGDDIVPLEPSWKERALALEESKETKDAKANKKGAKG